MSAESVINTIRRNYQNTLIIGTDINPQSSLYIAKKVDVFIQVPKFDDENYLKKIRNIVNEYKINNILPLTDPEIDILSLNRSYFSDLNVILCISNSNSISNSRDKNRLYNIFKNHELIKVPKVYNIHEIDISSIPYPVISKPNNGRSSEGFRKYSSPTEMSRILSVNTIFQEFIEGNIYTVDVVRSDNNNVVSLPRLELIRTSNGAGLTVQIESSNFELKNLAKTVVNELNLVGAINMEFIYDGQDYYLIDVNPRFSAGIEFSIISGFNLVQLHIDYFNGKLTSIKPQTFTNQIVTKVYKTIAM